MDSNLFSVLSQKLLECNYPFQWNPRADLENCPDKIIEKIMEKIEEKSLETKLQFETIILYTILGYEYNVENKMSDALETFEIAETKLKCAQEKDDLESFFKRLIEPMFHIILSCKAHVLSHIGEFQRAHNVCFTIPSIPVNDITHVAALTGLRAVFYSYYGICGMKMALKLASEAIIKNPKESLWYFLKGKYMGRIRRIEKPYDIPSREEVAALEKAMEVECDSEIYTVFTAQLYRETASQVFRFYNSNRSVSASLKDQIDKLNEESVKLYMKSIELRPNCVQTMFRCAKGFIMLPIPYKNYDKAKELLKRGLSLLPNSDYGNHTMAQYYERHEKNIELAIFHLKKCEKSKNFAAAMDLLRLEYQTESVDFVSRIMKLRENYVNEIRQSQLISQLISYHMFVTSDLQKACEYTNEFILLTSDKLSMTNHRAISLFHKDLMNLFDVLVDEIKIRIPESDCSSTERCMYLKLLRNLQEAGIQVSTIRAQFLKKQILEKGNSYTRMGSRRKKLHPRIKNKLLPKQGQISSWRQRDNVEELPKQFKSECSRKIDDVAEKWKAHIAATEKQNDFTYQKQENCDHENSYHENSDDDEDVALFTQIFGASVKVSAYLKNQHESVQNENKTWKKVDDKEGQTTKFSKKQSLFLPRTSSRQSEKELCFPSDNITPLATGIRNIYISPKETREYKERQNRIKLRISDVEAKEDSPQHNDYDEVNCSSENSENEKVSVKARKKSESSQKVKKMDHHESQQTKCKQKMRWHESYRTRNHDKEKNKNCEQLRSGESEDGFAEENVHSYKKIKKDSISVVHSRSPRKSVHKYKNEERYYEKNSPRTNMSVCKRKKYTTGVSDSDSNEYNSEEYYEPNSHRNASDKKSILEHEKNYKSKINKKSKKELENKKCDTVRRKMLKNNNYDSDSDDLESNVKGKISYKNEKGNFDQVKEKSKRRTKNDSCSSENLEELLREVVKDTAHFKPQTIKF